MNKTEGISGAYSKINAMQNPFLLVDLLKEDSDSTLSTVSIEGKKSFFSVEDEYREIKLKGETRVDDGIYPLALRDSPKFSHEYLVNPEGSFLIVRAKTATDEQRKLWKPHQLIWVKDTPRHEFILIHWGNTDDDTDGCLIIGNSIGIVGGQNAVLDSRSCYEKYYPIMARQIAQGNKFIQYKRDFYRK